MNKETKYFLRQYSQQQYRHGGVGYSDAEKILQDEGFLALEFPYHESFSPVAKISRFFHLIRLASRVKKNDVVVFLFPVYAFMNKWLLKRLVKKGARTICFIGDVNGLKDGDENELTKELEFLRRFHHFIVHNEKMKQWLDEKLPGRNAAAIEFFDFLTDPVTTFPVLSPVIVFAGNLEKSSFLEKLDQLSSSLHFNLYGAGQTQAMLTQKSATWQGVEDPHQLPAKISGAFGLLWDGDAIDKPGGSLGDYMQYITHHKLSLYILCRLPLIVPSSAASAPLVEKYKIGFLINSLYEVEEKVKNISPGEYQRMQDNMDELAGKISRGGCLKEALKAILNG